MTRPTEPPHLSDDTLVLHYYGEHQGDERKGVESHLAACGACRDALEQLQDVLGLVTEHVADAAPEGFERVMWARVQGQLEQAGRQKSSWLDLLSLRRLAFGGGMLALVLAAFFVGRVTQAPVPEAPVETLASLEPDAAVLLATREHLERAQMTLAEVLHADAGAPGLTAETSRAAELVAASRLIRQSLTPEDDRTLAGVLDDLERVLVEIANRADGWSPDELDAFKARLDAGGILFRLRVVQAEVSERRPRPAPPVT